jgi:sugar lactone lactonase YvrE
VPISIQTGAACAWSVSVLPSWITVAASSSGAGPATVTLVVAANAGAARSANISVAGQTVAVAQAAAAPSGQSGGIATFAGNGTQGFSGDGPAASTELNFPTGLAVDASGNLFIADQSNARIRKVSAAGIVTTVAGSGTFGFSGDNGPAVSASLNGPQGIAVDASGNLYIADTGNSRVRMVSTSGTIITVAGNGTAAFSGDGGSAISASLCFPFGVAVDTTGNLYIADTNNRRIRKVSANGIITTVAGGGTNGPGDSGPATSASLFPKGVAVNAAGDLLIADTGNSLIRKVTSGGAIATVAGNWIASFSGDGGPATSASLCTPFAVAIDASGNIFIGDTCNNRIRKVSAGGIVTTLAGNGAAGFSGDGGPAVSASMNSPRGVAVDSSGNVFFADAQNNRIREVLAQGASTPAITVSPSSLAFSLAAGGSSSQQINLASPSSPDFSPKYGKKPLFMG